MFAGPSHAWGGPLYPILHTQGTGCIVEDIEIYLKTHDSKAVPKMRNRSR